jgi:hypothetical protein
MKRVAVFAFLAGALLCLGTRAFAETRIDEPRGNPYKVTLDANGKPQPFTIAVTGFTPGTQVYVEQCNDRPISAENWLPARDCDIGSSPAAVIVDKDGSATFAADDPNHAFHPFVGISPQGQFRCVPPGSPSPTDNVPQYEQCQIRVSTNNVQSTPDQVFLPIVLGASKHSNESSTRTSLIVLVIVGLIVIVAVGLLSRRRSRTPSQRRG